MQNSIVAPSDMRVQFVTLGIELKDMRVVAADSFSRLARDDASTAYLDDIEKAVAREQKRIEREKKAAEREAAKKAESAAPAEGGSK